MDPFDTVVGSTAAAVIAMGVALLVAMIEMTAYNHRIEVDGFAVRVVQAMVCVSTGSMVLAFLATAKLLL